MKYCYRVLLAVCRISCAKLIGTTSNYFRGSIGITCLSVGAVRVARASVVIPGLIGVTCPAHLAGASWRASRCCAELTRRESSASLSACVETPLMASTTSPADMPASDALLFGHTCTAELDATQSPTVESYTIIISLHSYLLSHLLLLVFHHPLTLSL